MRRKATLHVKAQRIRRNLESHMLLAHNKVHDKMARQTTLVQIECARVAHVCAALVQYLRARLRARLSALVYVLNDLQYGRAYAKKKKNHHAHMRLRQA
jgi:hypothetical protein